MPFKSQAQRAFLYIHHPTIAKRWSKEYPNQAKLPEHVKDTQAQKSPHVGYGHKYEGK